MKTHSLILLAGLLITSVSTGAVLYTPGPLWRRDFCGETGGYCQDIDLDRDGTRDFYIWSLDDGCYLRPANDNNRIWSLRATLPDLGQTTIRVLPGELIGASPPFGSWIGATDYPDIFNFGSIVYYCNGRVTPGTPEQCISTILGSNRINYLGVQFESGGSLHYGWVSLGAFGFSSAHFVDLYGWAYETEPGQGILAGAGDVPEPSAALLFLFSLAAATGRRRR